MLRAWRTAGAVFTAYRFFYQTPPSTLQADFDDRKHHTIFLPKNLIYKYLFVFLQSKSRVPPMDLRLSIDIRAALPHSP